MSPERATPDELREALAAAVPDLRWLDGALHQVTTGQDADGEPAEVWRLLSAAGRNCGRSTPLSLPGWTAEDAARVLILARLPLRDEALARQVEGLYAGGDAAEKRAVLLALPMLPLGGSAVSLLHDAIRTNDTRLVAAALGPYAVHLSPEAWRQAVLKCVFAGVPLAEVYQLEERADAELVDMLAGLARERTAAGRSMPADAVSLLTRWER
jgi:hypothetical protein